VWLPLKPRSFFMNAMYGNIADKPAACSNMSRVFRSGRCLEVSHPEGRGFIEPARSGRFVH